MDFLMKSPNNEIAGSLFNRLGFYSSKPKAVLILFFSFMPKL